MTPQKINVKGTTNAGVVALVKVEDVDVSDAGFGEVDYSDHIVCSVSDEGDVIEISALPGIPAGEYIFYIFPTVTHMGTPVSTSEFSISLDVAEFDEDGIASVNLDPYEIYIETEEGVQSPLSEPIKLTAYTKEQTAVDVDWLGADFAWDEAEGERDYREYLEPVVNGDEISFRLLPGIPAGQYSWTLMPVLNTDRDYSVDEFNVTAYVAPRQGPQPVTITGLRYANGAVTIAWAESPGAEGYKVYRRVDGGSWTTIKKNTTETTVTDTNVTPGTKYYYVVRSHIGGVYSGGVSETAKSITIPNEPQPVTITDLSYANGAVNIAWAQSPGAESYRVLRKAAGGSWKTLAGSTTELSFADTGVTAGTKYYYLVRSQIGGVYNGNWSPTVKNITIPLEPMPVTINSLSYANGAVAIRWDAPPAADGYKVYRKVAGGSWTTIKKNTTETSFTDTNVTAGTKYYYVVRSHIGGVYNTGWTATVQSITIPASAPQPVTITNLEYANGAVNIAWAASPGAESYRVMRKVSGGSDRKSDV
jgi:fibronectin type 3 domain-containing protein